MAADVRIVEAALGELGELVEVLDRDGAAYARAYVEWLCCPEVRSSPCPPVALHRDLAAAVRDVVSDQALALGASLPVAAR